MNRIIKSLFVFFCLGLATVLHAGTPEDQSSSVTLAELQALLEKLQAKRTDTTGFAAAIILSDGTLVSTATGVADPGGRTMSADTPVRLASVTKTYVAAAVLRLWEDGLIKLDAPINGLIASAHDKALQSDGYKTETITVRHLLMHASGMNDHASGDTYLGKILSNPAREWTRTDQINVLIETTDPVGQPGEKFFYSDTGYILLGEMIERITGDPLGKAVKRLTKFKKNKINGTWWDEEDTPPAEVPERAHQWVGNVDAFGFHGSIDAYGGGGIIASVEDMARFYAALFAGKVFEKPETLVLMTEAPGYPKGSPYRIGLFTSEPKGQRIFGHSGFWGTDVVFLPDVNIVIAGASLNNSGFQDLRQFEFELLDLIAKD